MGAAVDEIRYLHLEAERARAEAGWAMDDKRRAALLQLADHYDREARRLNLIEAASPVLEGR